MPVIIRETRVIEDKEYPVKVYRTRAGKLVTDKDKKNAEQLDSFLSKKLKEIKQEMKDSGLLALKGKKGKVLRLWYEVGKVSVFQG